MSTATRTTPAVSLPAILTMLLGLLLTGYGLVVLSVSLLDGAWIAAIGLSVLFAGVFLTEWAGTRFDISGQQRRTLVVAFVLAGTLLLLSFVVLNVASFTVVDSGTSSR